MNGWARVELMGHNVAVGELSEIELFGVKMGRLNVLRRDGTRELQDFPGTSVYRITHLTEEAAREEMKPYTPYRAAIAGRPYVDETEFAPAPGDDEVDALFVPRAVEVIYFNAVAEPTDDPCWVRVVESPLLDNRMYRLEVYGLGDLFEPISGGHVTPTANGRFELTAEDWFLDAGTEYRFSARLASEATS